MTALESQIAEVLAYQHCRMTNSKADHPIFGYHAFSEEQREYLRSVMMPAAQAVAAMLAPVIREAQAEAREEGRDEPQDCCGMCPAKMCPWDDGGKGPTNPYKAT